MFNNSSKGISLLPIFRSILVVFLFLPTANSAHAWGERGHDIITRVAVQQLVARCDQNPACTKPFTAKDHMLAHLSNVPDIVWRANYMSQAERDANWPTHFIDLEFLYDDPKLITDLDTDIQQFIEKGTTANVDAINKVGTAPWRALQLYNGLVQHLKAAGAAEDEPSQTIAVNQALLYAGLMSHFVGDLANPQHTSANHDGQLTGNTGLHAYFESDVVSELPLSLIDKVQRKVSPRLLKKSVLKPYSNEESSNIMQNADQLIFAYLLESHQKLDRLLALDDRYAVIERSVDDKNPAKRKPAAAVTKRFKSLAIERLAMGATVLAELWYLAWQEAGEPDLSSYHSYEYQIKPAFIQPDYLGE